MPYNELVRQRIREWNRGHIVKYLTPILLLSARHISLDPQLRKRILFIYTVGQLEIINGISDCARENSSFWDASFREKREREVDRSIYRRIRHDVLDLEDLSRTKIHFTTPRGIHLVSLFLRNNYFAARAKFGSRVDTNIELYY